MESSSSSSWELSSFLSSTPSPSRSLFVTPNHTINKAFYLYTLKGNTMNTSEEGCAGTKTIHFICCCCYCYCCFSQLLFGMIGVHRNGGGPPNSSPFVFIYPINWYSFEFVFVVVLYRDVRGEARSGEKRRGQASDLIVFVKQNLWNCRRNRETKTKFTEKIELRKCTPSPTTIIIIEVYDDVVITSRCTNRRRWPHYTKETDKPVSGVIRPQTAPQGAEIQY